MARVIVLDAGPLGLASKPRGKPDADRCREWVRALDASGARVVVPEVCDYEVRRELIRAGATAGVARLDRLESVLDYVPITTEAMRAAADFWAALRKAGMPTAPVLSLDADCILAGQAWTLSTPPGDAVTVATTNVRHMDRFGGFTASVWQDIKP